MLSLRNKTYLIILTLSLVFFGFAYGTVWYIAEYNMRLIQDSDVKNNIDLVERILNREIENLAIKQSDWARWDDTYQFISDKNEAYISSNLNDESLRSLGVDVMIFVDNTGDLVYAKQLSLDGTGEASLPQSLASYATGRGELLNFSSVGSVKRGLLTTTEATYLIAAQPITTSDGRGATRGTIIFARYLTDEYNQLLSTLSGFAVQIAPYDARLFSEKMNTDSLSVTQPMHIEYVDGTIQGFKLIKNIFENSSLVLRVEHPASIIAEGREFLLRNFWYTLFALATYLSVLMVVIDLFLLRRIENMRQIARKVAVMQSGTALPEGDIDDFSYLATVMVSALKQANKADSVALGNKNETEKFKKVIDQSLDHTIITDPDGKIIYANPAAENMTGYTFAEMEKDTPRLWGRQMPVAFYQKMWETIRLRKEVFEGELINRRKDGTLYRAYARITPILDDKKRILYYIGNEHFLRKESAERK